MTSGSTPPIVGGPVTADPNNWSDEELEFEKPPWLTDPRGHPESPDWRDVGRDVAGGAGDDRNKGRIKQVIAHQIPRRLSAFGQNMTFVTTHFKEWVDTKLHAQIEGHIVRKWTSKDRYTTIDIAVSNWLFLSQKDFAEIAQLPHKEKAEYWKQAWEGGRDSVRKWTALLGTVFLRLEIKAHELGPTMEQHVSGSGVCQNIRCRGPMKWDRDGWFECHPTQFGPATPGPGGPASPGPPGPGTGGPGPAAPGRKGPSTPGSGGPASPGPPGVW